MQECNGDGMDLNSVKKFFGQCATLPSCVGSPHDRAETSTGNRDRLDKIALIQNRLSALRQGIRTKSFEQDLHQDLHRNWLYQRSVQQDGTSSSGYSDQRRDELDGIPGAEDIAGQYGTTLALSHYPSRSQLTQLSINNQVDSGYLRQRASEEYKILCEAIYDQHGNSNEPDVFVNSRHAAKKILDHLSHNGVLQGDPDQLLASNLRELQPGLLALTGLDENAREKAEALIVLYGARPSAYAIQEGANGPSRAVIDNPQVDNLQLLENLKGTAGNGVIDRLRAIPHDHGSAMMAYAAASMVDNLVDVLGRADVAERVRHNPILANGLSALQSIAYSMPNLSGDSYKFSHCYEALIEEIQVCLSAARPYSQDDFRAAALPLLAPGNLPETVPIPEVKLVSSGMGALTLGLDVAKEMTGSSAVEFAVAKSKGKTPVYFELEKLINDGVIHSAPKAATVYATLNPNIPSGHSTREPEWGVDAVIQAVEARLKKAGKNSPPMVLVLDATVEKRGDMDRLVHHFGKDIDQNRLRIVVCKSYQKYANLCSAKVMAGGIGIISADDQPSRSAKAYLNDLEKDLGWMEHNDAQLMTHFLKSREHEFNLLDRSIDNAHFVAKNFFHGKEGHARFDRISKALPFVLLADKESHKLAFRNGQEETVLPLKRGAHLGQVRVLERAGFAFTKTSLTSDIPDAGGKATRISFGQESQAELTENFYIASRLTKESSTAWGVREAYTHIQSLVHQALKGTPSSRTAQNLSQKLTQIALKERPKIDDIDRLAAEPTELRQQLQRNGAGGLTLNKIVSVVNHLGDFVLDMTEPHSWKSGHDRYLMDEILHGLVQSGMPGVSSSGRTSVLELQAFMCKADMTSNDEHQQQQGFQRLIDTFVRIPHSDSMPKCLRGIPDDVFGAATSIEQERAIRTLFLPLDIRTRMNTIERLIQFLDVNKAEACLNALEASLDRGNPVAAETFHPAQRIGTGDTLARIQAEESASLRSTLLKQRINLEQSRAMMVSDESSDEDI